MKKYSILMCLAVAIFSLAACTTSQKKEIASQSSFEQPIVADEFNTNSQMAINSKKRIFSDFVYDVGPRFTPITKTSLDKITTFSDFIGQEHAQRIVSYSLVHISVLQGDMPSNIVETGISDTLTAAQRELLQTSPYSTNILVRAEYEEKNIHTRTLEKVEWTPYLTIVPESQATYSYGKEALIDYLKLNSKMARSHVIPEKLQAAKLYFTVTSNGTINNVYLDRPSGYPEVDKTMSELIVKTQKDWTPAENAKGEKVDQELVVSFGLMGC